MSSYEVRALPVVSALEYRCRFIEISESDSCSFTWRHQIGGQASDLHEGFRGFPRTVSPGLLMSWTEGRVQTGYTPRRVCREAIGDLVGVYLPSAVYYLFQSFGVQLLHII